MQSDRKRELSALPNEELRNTLSRLMTLGHSLLILWCGLDWTEVFTFSDTEKAFRNDSVFD